MIPFRDTLLIAAALLLSLGSGVAHAQHEGDVWVGRSAAGQVKISPQGYDHAQRAAWLKHSRQQAVQEVGADSLLTHQGEELFELIDDQQQPGVIIRRQAAFDRP